MDLQFKNGNNLQVCLFNEAAYSKPVSTLSSTDASALIQENLDLEFDMLDSMVEASQFMSGSALYNEKELQFLNGGTNELNLVRGQSGRCVFWDEKTKKFCPEEATKGKESCLQHEDEECTKTGQAILEMGSIEKGTSGFSIMRDVIRWSSIVKDESKVCRYAPSLNGPLDAFKDGTQRFKKFLTACTLAHQDHLDRKPFNVQHFRDQLPNFKISDSLWRHGFNAMEVI